MSQVLSGQRVGVVSDAGRGAGGDDFAAGVVLAQAKVDDVVSVDDKVQVVFDHDDCGAFGGEFIEYAEKGLNIQGMEAHAGFVEDEDGTSLIAVHLADQLEALCFTARKGRGGLTEGEIAQAQFF